MYNYYSIIYIGGLCPLCVPIAVAKKNERLLGTKMKKFVILLLVFSLLGLTSCGLLEKVGIGKPSGTTEICEIASQSKPTKVTTEVHYVTNSGDELEGYYVTETDGTNAIFTYHYERLATPAESIELGNSDRILAFDGVINFKDGVYFVSGDISTNVLHMMYCMYYNKQLLEDYQLEEPTNLVFENKWTLDTLVTMGSGIYLDLNGNSKKDIADQFGFTIVNFHNDAFYTGSDLKLVEHDAEKTLIVSPDFFGEKAISVIEKLGPWETSTDVYEAGDYETPFTEGRSLFTINRCHYASKALRDSELSYGIVPVPKYDENQENYRTVMGNPVTLYSISVSTPKKDICAAVLECMASNGYRLTTPAIFENNMKKKYSVDDINAQMYDIVRESVSFELGRFMNKCLSNITDIFFAALVSNDAKWGSTAAKYSKPLSKQMEKVVESILENEAKLG